MGFVSIVANRLETAVAWILQLHPSQVLLISASIFTIWYIATSVKAWYRLRHIPAASFFANFSYLWIGGVTYSGKQFWVHRELHRRLGPLVRVGPNEVAIDDPGIMRRISGTQSLYPRSDYYKTGKFNPYQENLFSMTDIAEHKQARAKSMPAYSGRELFGIESIVDEQISVLMGVIRDRYSSSGGLLNLEKITCYFTLDVITSLGFGKPLGNMKAEKDHFYFLKNFHDMWPKTSTCAEVPWIRKILFSRPFLRLLGPKTSDATGFGALMGVAERYVEERFKSGGERKDMLHSFMKHGLNQEECESEVLLMLLAGTESTACAIRSTLIHAVTHYEVCLKLKQEINLAIKEGRVSRPISMEEAWKLPYLQAVVWEGIRMRPPLLGFFPKVVPPPGDNLFGIDIPAGTSIMTNISALLCSQSAFGVDADVYRPERFLELDAVHRREMERNVELAFGYGQWQCAGKHIAMMEINKCTFEIFREFDIQLISPMKPFQSQSYGIFLEPELNVKVTKALDLPIIIGQEPCFKDHGTALGEAGAAIEPST